MIKSIVFRDLRGEIEPGSQINISLATKAIISISQWPIYLMQIADC